MTSPKVGERVKFASNWEDIQPDVVRRYEVSEPLAKLGGVLQMEFSEVSLIRYPHCHHNLPKRTVKDKETVLCLYNAHNKTGVIIIDGEVPVKEGEEDNVTGALSEVSDKSDIAVRYISFRGRGLTDWGFLFDPSSKPGTMSGIFV